MAFLSCQAAREVNFWEGRWPHYDLVIPPPPQAPLLRLKIGQGKSHTLVRDLQVHLRDFFKEVYPVLTTRAYCTFPAIIHSETSRPLPKEDPNSLASLLEDLRGSETERTLPEARKAIAQHIIETSDSASLRYLRLRAGLSQSELAAKVGIQQPRIAEFEAGKHLPGLDISRRLARALNISLDKLADVLLDV